VGFSTIGAQTIFFIAFIVILASTYGTVGSGVRLMNDALSVNNDLSVKRLHTHISIVEADAKFGKTELIIRNTGSETLETDKISVLMDGELVDRDEIDVNASLWLPQTDIEMKIDERGDRVKIVTENGISAYCCRFD
jgi:archaellum component FlaF (FlaF/FlaG flagellin family)